MAPIDSNRLLGKKPMYDTSTDPVTSSTTPATTAAPPPSGGLDESPRALMEVVNDLMQGKVDEATLEVMVKYAVLAVGALLAMIVAYFLSKLISRWVSNVLCRRVDQTLGRFAGKFSFYSLFSVCSLAVLQTAGMSVTSFAAILAAAGFAIGLAFQGTLSNFASGILLMVFRPFKVGDVVNAAGVMGKINEIDLFTTTFDTPDNRRLIVPNSSIAGATIENVSHHPERRVEVVVGVAYNASLDATREVLTAAAESLGDTIVSGEGRGFQILLSNLGASSVDWTVRAWVKSKNFFPAKEKLTVAIKNQLDERGIEIPFPQMQLHISESAEDVAEPEMKAQLANHPTYSDNENLFRNSGIRPRARS